MNRILLSIVIGLVIASGSAFAEKIPEGYVRFLCQPNGWGDTPENAERDLMERIMPYYKRVYGHKPGFTIHGDVAIVHIGRNMYQADGRCSWYVPRAKTSNPRSVKQRFHQRK